MFNTRNYLYLIDRNGNNVDGYPVRLKSPATAGINVFDYEKTKNYRVFLPQGKSVYLLTKSAKKNPGWKVFNAKNIVDKPVDHIRINKGDYLFVHEEGGKLNVLDRTGKTKIKLSKDVKIAENASINPGNFDGITKFVTTDQSGQLVSILQNGEVEIEKINTYSSDHYFTYQDIHGDKLKDFLFVEGNILSVYNHQKEKQFEYVMQEDVSEKPYVLTANDKQIVAILSAKTNELVLLDKDKNVVNNSPLVGSTEICVGKLYQNSRNSILVGSESYLYNYPLE